MSFGAPPVQGRAYNFDNIPQEMKDRPQWVVFQIVDRNGRKTKPPFRSSDPRRPADTSDPATWGTYDEAVACYQANPWLEGIGYVFTPEDGYFGVDIDDKEIKPEFKQKRESYEADLLGMKTYTERSPSGKGYHIIGRGKPPRPGAVLRDLGIEVYGSARYFTMTGNVVDGKNTITAQPDFIASLPPGLESMRPSDWILGDMPRALSLSNGAVINTSRRMDLSDNDVIEQAFEKWPEVRARYECLQDCEPGTGRWAKIAFYTVVAKLDLITGDVAQIRRIVMASPMVTQCRSHTNGETRPKKAARIFFSVLAGVRQNNNFIVHGKRMVENMMAAKAKRADEAMRLYEEEEGKLSPGAARVLNSFPQIDPAYRVLSRPPGVTGEFVQATEQASHLPFTKYAIPATLAVLSGIVGRQYKVDGYGLNLNLILVAPTASGKTNTMVAWEDFIAQANNSLPATISGPPKSRMIKNSTSSIQGMMPFFMKQLSCVWFVEEAGSLLKLMNDSKNGLTGAMLRDKFNELYDCSRENSLFNAPASSESRKAGIEPICNLNVSTFFTTVPSKFEGTDQDAFDGFLSRVVLVRHKGRSGVLKEMPNKLLSQELLQILRDRLAAATDLDEKYAIPAARPIYHIEINPEVRALYNELRVIAQGIVDDAHDDKIPGIYTAVSRLAPIALRMAGTLAVMESPYAPEINETQLKWSFGYLLHNQVNQLSDMDTGETGDKANEEFIVIRKMITFLMKRPEFKKMGGVPTTRLKDNLRSKQPFKSARSPSYTAVTDALKAMVTDKLIETSTVQQSPKGGRATEIYFLTAEGLSR